jgi:GT2 family glycosyltransferase
VFLLNQDCVVEPQGVEQLARALDENSEYGIMSALAFSYDDNSIERGFLGFTRGDRVDDEYWYDLVQGQTKEVYELKFVNAAAVLVRGEVLREIGGFDPLFFMYGEDRDLCRRVLDAGWKIGFAPAARVRHWNGGLHGPTQGETLGWAMTMEYNRALLRFKSGRRSLGMACAGFVWSLVTAQWQALRSGSRMLAARLAAAVQVLLRLPWIARGLRRPLNAQPDSTGSGLHASLLPSEDSAADDRRHPAKRQCVDPTPSGAATGTPQAGVVSTSTRTS